MNPQGTIKLLREVRDLQVIDKDGRNCGICDDLEFTEASGALALESLLIGPGAMLGRFPRWLSHVWKTLGLNKFTRVPWQDVESVTSRIRLKKPASSYGLTRLDNSLARYLKRLPSL
jgi:sporulation protein YlmC with PRC-barrel domain